MTWTYAFLWLGRILGIAFFMFAHLLVVTALVTASLGGLLARGPQGEELGHGYRESPEGRRTEMVVDVLSWPIEKPISTIQSELPGSTLRSTAWRAVRAAGLYGNSVVWGIGIWLLFEGLTRGGHRLLRGRRKQAGV